MFMVDDHYQILQPTSQFFAAQLLTQEWAQPKDAEHLLYRAVSEVRDSAGHVLVTAYALHRPDGYWSLMLINKDHDHSHLVSVLFQDKDANRTSSFAGQVTMITFGKEQYQWHSDRRKGYADPDGPPVQVRVNANESTRYDLPPASVTVLRGVLAVAPQSIP